MWAPRGVVGWVFSDIKFVDCASLVFTPYSYLLSSPDQLIGHITCVFKYWFVH